MLFSIKTIRIQYSILSIRWIENQIHLNLVQNEVLNTSNINEFRLKHIAQEIQRLNEKLKSSKFKILSNLIHSTGLIPLNDFYRWIQIFRSHIFIESEYMILFRIQTLKVIYFPISNIEEKVVIKNLVFDLAKPWIA